MLELLLGVSVVVGLGKALRARHRVAATCGAIITYLLIADIVAALTVSTPHQLFDVFSYMFLGPLALPARMPSFLPLPNLALAHPLSLRITRIGLAALAAWRCLSESSRLNPLLPRAYTLDSVGLTFVGAAVVDAIEGVLLVWAALLNANGI